MRYPKLGIELLKNALPTIGNRGFELMGDFMSMLMLSKIDPDRQSAASLIASMMIIVRSIPATWLYYTSREVRVQQAESKQGVGSVLRHSWMLALPLGMAGASVALLSKFIFDLLGQPKASAQIATNFLLAYAPGLIPTLLNISSQQTLYGLVRPFTVLSMTAIHTPLLLGLGYLLTFTLDLKETGLGIAYSAIALLHFLSYLVLFKINYKDYLIFNFRDLFISDGKFILLAQQGFWIALYAALELGNVWFNTILIGRTQQGKEALADLQPALQYASILANLTFVIGSSTTVLVTGYHKKADHSSAGKLGNVGILIGLILPLAAIALFLADPDLMLAPFLGEEISSLARTFLLINLLGQISDTFRNVSAGALRGLGNTSFPANVNLMTTLVAMPLTIVTQKLLDWGPETILAIRTIGIITAGGSLITANLIFGKWFKQSSQSHADGADGYQVLPANDPKEQKGCWSRFRNYLFKPRQPQMHLQQPEPAQQTLPCCIL